MGFGTNPIQNANHEDRSQSAITGRPLQNTVHSIYVKGSEPWWRRWWATRDAFDEHHWEVLICAKFAFKGAITAALIGATQHFRQRSVNAVEVNKALVFANKNGLTGPTLIAARQAIRHGSLGAVLGVAYFFWFYQLVCKRGHEHTFNGYLFGHAAFGAALASVFSIRRAGLGALAGASFGWIYFNTAHGNSRLGNKAEQGINFEFSGLTPEQREAIRQRDLITHLSRTPEFRLNLLNKV